MGDFPTALQLEYSIYIGVIAVTLLNFGTKPTTASFIVAGVFTLLTVLSVCYSLYTYLYRSQAIRNQKVARYYDKWGPSVLGVSLLFAVLLNFGFEGRQRNLW